ncbi:EAL domain protein, partial [Vibrio cholerae HC-50A2]
SATVLNIESARTETPLQYLMFQDTPRMSAL